LRYRGFTLTNGDQVERVSSVDVSPALLQLLAVPPIVGRLFTDDEERPGHQRQLVLSHATWMRRFGGDPGVVGKTLQLDDATHTVVGVMPRDFRLPATDPDVEMWSPLTLDLGALASRPHRMYQAIGRLATGATLEQARQDMAAVASGNARENPDTQAGWGVTIVPAHEQVVGNIGETLWVLFGAVVLVLVIACANIANLLLARSARAPPPPPPSRPTAAGWRGWPSIHGCPPGARPSRRAAWPATQAPGQRARPRQWSRSP
jgi:putative ABC transport system permease protein